MNATGESDLRNFYDRLQAMQKAKMRRAMWWLEECIIRSGSGSRDADIYYEWAPPLGLEKEKADSSKRRPTLAPVGGYFAWSGNYTSRSCVRTRSSRMERCLGSMRRSRNMAS
ncbi:phage portal protein [Ensifer sp. Root31]|uniref:anti-CBASS protein Acb1 family protein n=1 Tax=Ensifer sp. Root31 TaxID=1736512 RepID=UPI000AB285AB|nr:anti-CBASS Acb1 family protein [Ensifer sp. Root31]